MSALDFFTPYEITLFHIHGSVASPLVQVVHDLKIPIELFAIKAEDLSNSTILELNPHGQVPILAFPDNDPLTTVGCIGMYFLEKHDGLHILHPNPKEDCDTWVQFNQMLFYTTSTLFPLLFEDTDIVQKQKIWDESVCPRLEAKLISLGNKYILGTSLSFVDFLLGHALHEASKLGFLNGKFPQIENYLLRLKERPSWKFAYEEETSD